MVGLCHFELSKHGASSLNTEDSIAYHMDAALRALLEVLRCTLFFTTQFHSWWNLFILNANMLSDLYALACLFG